MTGYDRSWRGLADFTGAPRAAALMQNCRAFANVLAEWLGAIDDTQPGLPAQELVVRGLVGILKTAPPADIENQNGVERTLGRKRIVEKLLELVSAFQRQAAFPASMYVATTSYPCCSAYSAIAFC
jgi:hypothetical protein